MMNIDFIDIYELINKTHKSIIFEDIIYFNKLEGWLHYSNIINIFDDFIIIIRTNDYVVLTSIVDKKTITLTSGIHIINNYVNTKISSNSQVIIVKHDLYKALCISCMHKKVEDNYDSIMALFDAVEVSKAPEKKLTSLVKLITVNLNTCNIHSDYEKIRQVIIQHCKNPKFNLDIVCQHAFMSRRKIQYVLSEQNLTFINLTQQCRLSELKCLLSSATDSSIETLAKQCGFRNIGMARRAFQKHFNKQLSYYKKPLN